ncbi:MAG: MATE family efflux transporter, partial [Bacteroidota bacterium]
MSVFLKIFGPPCKNRFRTMRLLHYLKTLYRLFWQSLSSEVHDFTSISLKRAIVLLAVPMVLEMMMESLFAVVDAYFVSKVSVSAIATVGFTESVLTLVYSIGFGVSMAATAMVARRIGEKNPEGARRAGAQALYLGIGLAVPFSIAGLFFAEDILHLMGASEQVIAEGA